jgi:hypothetical protein
MAVIEVDVTLETDQNGVQEAVPHLPPVMFRPDSVHYRSKDGTVRIVFDSPELSHSPTGRRSPFLDGNGREIMSISSSDKPVQLKTPGVFFCHCFLTPPGKPEIGWGATALQSGGNHVVK